MRLEDPEEAVDADLAYARHARDLAAVDGDNAQAVEEAVDAQPVGGAAEQPAGKAHPDQVQRQAREEVIEEEAAVEVGELRVALRDDARVRDDDAALLGATVEGRAEVHRDVHDEARVDRVLQHQLHKWEPEGAAVCRGRRHVECELQRDVDLLVGGE